MAWQVLAVLQELTRDASNEVWIISGRAQQELDGWFQAVVSSSSE
jgi:trehalose-6-phosphatase